MDFSTRAILELFNIHDLRVIAAKLGQSEKYGKRSDYIDDGRSLTQKPKSDLVDIIAGLADIVIMTNPEQRSGDDLNTDFILDKFNIGTLRTFVKHIGKQDEIKTFRRVEKAGKMVSENLNKAELMEKLKPLVRFGLNTISTKAGIVVPDIKKPEEQDELFNELDRLIRQYRSEGYLKSTIIDNVTQKLDDAYDNIIKNTELVNNPVYNAVKSKYDEIKKAGYTAEKDRVELRKYIRAAKKYSNDLVDITSEKLGLLENTKIQELLSGVEATRKELGYLVDKEARKAALANPTTANTEPKKKRGYQKGGAVILGYTPQYAQQLNTTYKSKVKQGDVEIEVVKELPKIKLDKIPTPPKVGRGRPRIYEPQIITKTKRELQRERKLEKELEKTRLDEERASTRTEKKDAKAAETAAKKKAREDKKAARALTN